MAPDRRFLQVNASFCSMLGYAENELLARTADAVTDPADLAASLANLERLLAGEVGSFQTQTRYRHKLGHVVWCSVSVALAMNPTGEPARLVMQAQDVSVRKKVETALRESEARYRGMVESQQDIVSRSGLDYRLTFVNDAFCKKFGLRREDLLGESHLSLVYEEDVPGIVAAIGTVAAPPYRGGADARVVTPDGLRWISWEGSAIRDERGAVVEIQAVGRDVTERREAEDAMRSLLGDLRQSEERLRLLAQRQAQIREEERKRLGFDLHDDVCQELVGIGMLIEAARRRLPPVAAETSAEFDRIGRYLGNVVEHLRLLARDLRPMQLADLGLEESLRVLAKGLTSPSTEVRAEFAKPVARLEEEVEMAVYRIAQEALLNAVRHAAANTVVLRLETDDAVVRLEVRDDGCGFVPEVRSHAQAIGLESMRERATALGGHLEVWSEPGKGTAVRLECPIVRRAQSSSAYRRPA
jgi:PAS domain S-box-containing protein